MLGLTAVLAALPLLAWHPWARRAAGGAEEYRELIFWGIPAAAAVAAAGSCLLGTLWARLRDPAGRPPSCASPSAADFGFPLRLVPLCALAFAVDYSFLALGHLTGWSTFTYGDQALSAAPIRTAIWGLPLCLVLGVVGWERALRGGLLAGWAEHLPRAAAAAISGAVGVLLVAPSIVQGPPYPDVSFILAALFAACCREASYCVLFLSGGGSMGGLYRGWLYYLEGLVIGDWYGLFFPAANYTSSEPRFYLMRALTAALSAAVLIAGARRLERPSSTPQAQES
jgi:hypothetical protein